MEIDSSARTDTGRVRQNNEDSFRLAPTIGLFVLSDGMGGLACGEVASQLAVDTIIAHCRGADADASLALCGTRIADVSDTANRLASAVRLANHVVREATNEYEAGHDPSKPAMGATVVALRIVDGRASIAHVGDSRAYRLRGEAFEQLTRDHSFIEEQVRCGVITQQEAGTSSMQNVLVRALGAQAEVEVDIYEEPVLEDDILLLCSDGLTRELSDAQTASVLRDADSAEQAAENLINLANQAGGADNITAIVLRCAPKRNGAFARVGKLGKWLKNSRHIRNRN